MLPAMTLARTASADECQAYTKPRQQALSPADALRLLREGNERFVANKPLRCDLPAQVRLIEGLHALGPGELASLSRHLQRVVQGMGAAGEPPSMLFVDGAGAPRAGRRL